MTYFKLYYGVVKIITTVHFRNDGIFEKAFFEGIRGENFSKNDEKFFEKWI